VQLGSQVRFREASGERRTVRIRDDANWAHDMLDAGSPLGRALMGRGVGEEVEVHLAASLPTRRVTIEAIE
jgi:transcription elongation GreA/GreB family factor